MHTATATSSSELPRPLRWVAGLLAGWPFAVFALTLFSTLTLLSVATVAIPTDDTALGSFALSFKTWCFGYDAATGRIQTVYVVTMVMQACMLSALVAWLWARPLAEAWRSRKRAIAAVALGTMMVSVGSLALLAPIDDGVPTGELPFPADELRIAHTPPAFRLIDHQARPVSIGDFAGKVVIVTAIYASCGETCPTIMAQARRVIDAVPAAQRNEIVLLAVTLDPEHDDLDRLRSIAAGQELDDQIYHLLSGEPAEVNRVLDALQIARSTNPETGLIEHANLFLLIDRKGKLAYRLSIGAQQARWMSTAVGLLLAE